MIAVFGMDKVGWPVLLKGDRCTWDEQGWLACCLKGDRCTWDEQAWRQGETYSRPLPAQRSAVQRRNCLPIEDSPKMPKKRKTPQGD